MYTSDFTRSSLTAAITAPAYACPTRITGPVVLSKTWRRAAASSARVVRGIGAVVTLNPMFFNGKMTLLQQYPSAHAPWTSTAVPIGEEGFIVIPSSRETPSWWKLSPGRASLRRSGRYPRTGPAHLADLYGTPQRL